MAFQGDVAQIPLSNILQALLLNGQEGVLRVELGGLKRRIRLLKKGLRLLNHESDFPDLLKQVLIKLKVLTEPQFQNTFSTWIPGSVPPGDFLLSRRILTHDLVTTKVVHCLQDILLDVLLTPRLKYEFNAEEDASTYELFSPDGLGDHLIFNSNAILMEAVRREDEWRRFKEAVPSGSEIFTSTQAGGVSAKDIEAPPHHMAEIKPFLNGECTVDRMVSSTTLSSFEVYNALFQLKQKGLIRQLDLQEKKGLAEKFRRSLRTADALEISKSILATDPHDRSTRLQIVAILEKSPNSQEELVEHYLEIAADFEDTNREQAKSLLEKALSLSPANLKALELLFQILHASGSHREAMGVARSVITAAKTQKNTQEATGLLYKILNYYPEETLLFHELAEIHLATGDSEGALECLRSAADLYERKRDYTRLRKTYERIVRIKPDETNRLRRVIHLEQRTKRTGGRILKFVLGAGLLASLVSATLYLVCNEVFARRVYTNVLHDIDLQRKYGHFDRALRTLEDFERIFPLTSSIREAQDLLKDINRSLITRQEETRRTVEKLRLDAEGRLGKARIAVRENDYVKALDLLDDIPLEGLKQEQAQEISNILGKLRKYFGDADALVAAAELSEKNQDFVRGHAIRKQILDQFPHSRAARDLSLPVLIETTPPGAEVIVDGKLLGQTPLLLRLPVVRLPSILISKRGYAAVQLQRDLASGFQFNPVDSHRVAISLEKSVEWRFKAGASIDGFPAIIGDRVCFGTRNGEVVCLRQETGEVVWTFRTPENMDITGGIGIWSDVVYFGSFDGKIYVLSTETGKPVHAPYAASTEFLPIKSAPSAASEKGLVAVNCDRKLLVAYNVSTGKAGWALSFPSTRILGQPIAYQGSLYVTTQGGEVLEIDHESGEVKQKMLAGAELASRGRAARDRYYIGTVQGKLLAFDLKSGNVAWSYDCGDKIVSPPTLDSEWVIVPTAKGKLLCFTTDGTFKWASSLSDPVPPDGEGVIFRNNLHIGTRRGQLLCIDVWSGRAVWHFKTSGFFEKEERGVLSSGVVSKGKLFIGAEDHFFYGFSLD